MKKYKILYLPTSEYLDIPGITEYDSLIIKKEHKPEEILAKCVNQYFIFYIGNTIASEETDTNSTLFEIVEINDEDI